MSQPAFAAIWDVDGTLVDTAELHFNAWATFAIEIGKPFTRNDFAATFGKRNPEIIRQLFDGDANDFRCGEWGERKEVHYRRAAEQLGIVLLPGVAALLQQFSDLGWAQAIGSSAPRANLAMILDLTGTSRFFSAVVSGEDVARGKPDPEVFLIAAKRAGVPSECCIVLEDAAAGVVAAKAAGMACVAVTAVGHHSTESLLGAGADAVVESLAAIDANRMRELFHSR